MSEREIFHRFMHLLVKLIKARAENIDNFRSTREWINKSLIKLDVKATT